MSGDPDRREWIDQRAAEFGAWLDKLPSPDVQRHVDADLTYLRRIVRDLPAHLTAALPRLEAAAESVLSRLDDAAERVPAVAATARGRVAEAAKGLRAAVATVRSRVGDAASRLGPRVREVEATAAVVVSRVVSAVRAMVTRVDVKALLSKDSVRVALAVVVGLAVILGAGIGFGRWNTDVAPAAKPSASPSELAAPELQPAAVQRELAPQTYSLALLNPITGPDRPPLPEDEHGPSGSRRTTGTQEVALTFDDGPDPRFTPEVLALLAQYHVKATFCLIGVNVVQFPDVVRQIVAQGHTLCNHSWVHDLGLASRGTAAIMSDLSRTNDAIHTAAPRARISYYRQPGGMWTQTVVESARQLGMTSLHWDVDPKDWLKPGPRSIATTITTGTLPGAIVLMHDGGGDRRGTVEALRTILPNLTARFSLVALPPGVDQPRLYGVDLPVHIGQE